MTGAGDFDEDFEDSPCNDFRLRDVSGILGIHILSFQLDDPEHL